MHDVKAAHRTRVQVERFSGKLSDGLPKVGRRAVREILYGVQARGSVRLPDRPELPLYLVVVEGPR